MKGFSTIFLTVSGVLYVALGVNVLVTLTTFPVWALGLLVDIRKSWVALAIVFPLLGPAIAGAYTVFRDYSDDGSTSVVRTFFRGWRRTASRALPIALLVDAVGVVAAVDVVGMGFGTTALGTLMLPVGVVAVVLALLTASLALTAVVDTPALRRRDALKLGLVRAVRSPLTSLVTLAVGGMLTFFLVKGVSYALAFALSPVLYVTWANSRYALGGTWGPKAPADRA